jgi:Ca2+-binding EF-hand superfamily protein
MAQLTDQARVEEVVYTIKKIAVLLFIALIPLGCATSAPAGEPYAEDRDLSEQSEEQPVEVHGQGPEEVLSMWQEAIKAENIGMFVDQYWSDAQLEVVRRNGKSENYASRDAIRAHQERIFEEFDFHEDMKLPAPQFHKQEGPNAKSFRIIYESGRMDEWLTLAERDGRWKIAWQMINYWPPGMWVTGRYQSWADANGNGFLEGEEHGRLKHSIIQLIAGEHRAETQTDEFFDENGDGYIDGSELERVRKVLFYDGYMRCARFDPVREQKPLDLDGDGQVDEREVVMIVDFMFGTSEARKPSDAVSKLDRKLDLNGDGFVSRDEMSRWTDRWADKIIGIPFHDEAVLPVPREVSLYMDELADINGDGRVDRAEAEALAASMGKDHEADNYIDWQIDENKNGHIQWIERTRVRQASAMGKRLRPERAQPPFPVRTAVDEILDINGNGTVESDEIGMIVGLFIGDPEKQNIPASVRGFFDLNRDGRITQSEMQDSKWRYLHPHAVHHHNPLDPELDANGDGFIVAEELGITAGMSAKGACPGLKELIERARWQRKEKSGVSGPDPYDSMERLTNKKLAVLGLDAGSESIDEDTARGVVVFIENAMINVGNVAVVDRRNIDKIVEEQKLQTTALTDETTAVEIGKISGADIIVVGSLNYVGKRYYLNIKLIQVENSEIVGSSIAEAGADTGFFDMCNRAVYALF